MQGVYLKDEFENWLSEQIQENGSLYSKETIKGYIYALSKACSDIHNLNLVNSNLFSIGSLDEFISIVKLIKDNPDYKRVNKKFGKGQLSAGMTKYKEFLTSRESSFSIPSVDFDREVKLENLFFEDKELIIKQVKTALSKGKNVILTGPPGTGKSKLAKEICRSFGVEFVMTTATSDWSTYETIGGSRPNADGTLSFRPGLFLNCFKDEKTLRPENKWLIIDEMNRADIDKAFGALFSALTGDPIVLSFQGESDNQIKVRPQNDLESVLLNDHDYIIPNDWRLIGTMNTIDKASLYEMSYAFMRRFAFIPVGIPRHINEELVNSYLTIWGIESYEYSSILAFVWKLINEYRQIGPAIVEDIAQFTEEDGDFTSAVILYVLPQFEGLLESEILEFIKKLGQMDEFEIERLKDFAADFFHIRE
ncbi:AAA family ATPase [Bacillus dakarensis]|uniref:AAA family ATPase n=1 Tax=Robertmurraya dakarensis TaxID=1926278 RepID=UPI000980B710|nr:MoxR family ATPase [Bacillus dakarensis]